MNNVRPRLTMLSDEQIQEIHRIYVKDSRDHRRARGLAVCFGNFTETGW